MLSRLRRLVTGTNQFEDRSPSIQSCMNYILMGLYKHLSNECYGWNENEGVRRFECLILSRFLLEFALLNSDGFSEGKKQFYRAMIQMVFEETLTNTFPWLKVPDVITNRLETYSGVMAETSPPTCWQTIAGTCTGTDYYAAQEQPALNASSVILPALLQSAQEFWEKLI